MARPSKAETLHATCVSIDGSGVLIVGPSGSGKSGLALQLMALGADLVSDDRTDVTMVSGALRATAPPTIAGLIEARGVGILNAPVQSDTAIALIVDMGQAETERLPHRRLRTIQGVTLPCLHKVDAAHFAAAVLLYLRRGISQRA